MLEVNPRSSRTVPHHLEGHRRADGQDRGARSAARTLGRTESGRTTSTPAGVFVKSPVFPFVRFPGVDTILGPEMKSTGEVMGGADNFGVGVHQGDAGRRAAAARERAACSSA